jgi:DNA helicase-2/ATP-dependent DNA helicase PcrA
VRRSFDRRALRPDLPTTPSRFLAEVPPDLVETVHGGFGARRSRLPFAGREALAPDADSQVLDESPQPPAGLGGSARTLVGQRVRHPTFGVGTILDVDEDGDDRRFTIRFPSHGTRKLIERYAKLRRL